MSLPSIDDRPIKLFGNLPFNMAAPLLVHWMREFHERRVPFEAIVMLQKEMVERICAKEGESERNRLSVLVQSYCEVTPLMQLSRAAFTPRPRVDASVLRLVTRDQPILHALTFDRFAAFIQRIFAMKRKTLRQNLIYGMKYPCADILDNTVRPSGISLLLRPQDLSLSQIETLYRCCKHVLF